MADAYKIHEALSAAGLEYSCLSWSAGFNLFGDRKSIDEVERLQAEASRSETFRRQYRQALQDHATAMAEIERLRAAAERICWFDWSGNDPDAVQSIDALRELLNIHKQSETT